MSPDGQSLGSNPYARLADLAEAERDLAVAGRIDELLAVQARRAGLVAELPATAPAGARAHLLRAAEAQAQVTAALATAMRAARADAVHVDRGRAAVAAYRPGSAMALAPGRIARRG